MFLEQPTEEHVFGLVLSTIIYKGALRRIKKDVPKNLIPVIHEMVQTVNGFVNIIDPTKKIQKELYKADNLILNSTYAMRKTCPQEKLAKASHLNAVVSYSILMHNTLFLDYYITQYEETRQLKYYEEAMSLQVHAYNVLYFINAETKDMAYLDSLKDKDGTISKKVQIQAMEQLKKKDIEYIKQIQANPTIKIKQSYLN